MVDDTGAPPKLLGWDVVVNDNMDSGFDAAATADNFIAVVGDFRHYQAVYRVGTTIELVPHLFGTAANLPSGQRGFYAYTRVGGGVQFTDAFSVLNVATTA